MKKIGTQFNNTPLVVEKNNYTRKILKRIRFRLLAKNSAQKFYIKKLFFGATNIVKTNDKEKYVHSDYRVAFDGNLVMNLLEVLMIEVDNSSLSHTDNLKYEFLILSEVDTFGINRSFGAPERKFLLILAN